MPSAYRAAAAWESTRDIPEREVSAPRGQRTATAPAGIFVPPYGDPLFPPTSRLSWVRIRTSRGWTGQTELRALPPREPRRGQAGPSMEVRPRSRGRRRRAVGSPQMDDRGDNSLRMSQEVRQARRRAREHYEGHLTLRGATVVSDEPRCERWGGVVDVCSARTDLLAARVRPSSRRQHTLQPRPFAPRDAIKPYAEVRVTA